MFVLASTPDAAVRQASPARPGGPGKHFRAGGVTLWYDVRGAGTKAPLVVVNGGPGVSHAYVLISDVWDVLARDRRVVFYDQRGVGRSSRLAKGQTCTLADQIEDLDALRRQLGLERMNVLGHSWGGILAMGYAARYPQRVSKLILCDSGAPKFEDTKFLFKDVFPESMVRQDALEFAASLGDTLALQAQFREYQSMLAIAPELRQSMRDGSLPEFVLSVNSAIVEDLKKIDLGPSLAGFTFPTLVITGRFDINVAPSVAWKIHERIPNSQFKVFERSGHLPFLEEPDEFLETLEAFLESPVAGGH